MHHSTSGGLSAQLRPVRFAADCVMRPALNLALTWTLAHGGPLTENRCWKFTNFASAKTMFVLTQTLSKSLMGLINWIRCSTLNIAQCACRIRPSRPLRTPKSKLRGFGELQVFIAFEGTDANVKWRHPEGAGATCLQGSWIACGQGNQQCQQITPEARHRSLVLFHLRSNCCGIFIPNARSQFTQSRFQRVTA